MTRARKSSVALLALFLTLPARAELTDSDKPINIESDKATLDDAKKIATFSGNVVLTQGTFVLRSDKLTVKQNTEGFRSGVATGSPATFRQKREGMNEWVEGEGARLEFDGKTDTLHVIERARVKRGADEVRGNHISYNSRSEFIEIKGGRENAADSSQRAKVVIQPKEKNNGKNGALPLKPSSGVSKPDG